MAQKNSMERRANSAIISGMDEPQDNALPPITDELLIDIYANPILNTLVIIIDKPFAAELTGLEFDKNGSRLLFLFGETKRDLGDPLRDTLLPFFMERDEIEIYQIDIKTKQPLASWTVPLKVI